MVDIIIMTTDMDTQTGSTTTDIHMAKVSIFSCVNRQRKRKKPELA